MQFCCPTSFSDFPFFPPAGRYPALRSTYPLPQFPADFFPAIKIFSAHDTIDLMTQRFDASQWVPYPVELVFAFFANPTNLPHLMPRKLEARIEDARLQPPPPRPVHPDEARRFRSVAAGEGSEILISLVP